ncbi:MAG: ABC transporter substrate-binding protein [Chloroflexi bacterium]|nr:ABC transporter substrate-binding protein [Chloroflexota bacterium]
MMLSKWVNGATALVLVLSLFLGACSEAAPTAPPSLPVTPQPAVATPAATTSPAVNAPTTAATKSAPAQPAAPKPGATPKPEKVVALVEYFGLEGFLPHNDTATAFKLLPGYEALWGLDPVTRALRPMLAETLPQWSEDGKTLFINLRQGVQFQGGYGEMTAEDVKFSIELGGRDTSTNTAKGMMAAAKVEILGPHKLAIHLPQPDWAWPLNVATLSPFLLPIVSKKYVETVGEKEAGNMPIGTGPFKLVKHEFGKSLEFEAVPNHWRVTPDYKTLVIKLIGEPATAIAMLRTGEADIAGIPSSFVPEARAAGLDIRLIRNIGAIGVALGGQYLSSRDTYDPNVPWVLARDPERALKVRKALNLAVNRQEIIDKVLNGIGEQWPAISSINNDASWDPSWKPYPYDPVEAKRLLAEAGYPNGIETTMILFPSTGHATKEIGEAVASYWEKIGISVKRLTMDQATHRTRQIGRRNAGFAFPAYRNTYSDDMISGTAFYGSKSTGMNQQFEHARIDDFITRATAELNVDKRMQIEYEFHKFVYDNYLTVPISIEHFPLAVTKRIGDWPSLSGDPYLNNFEYVKLK